MREERELGFEMREEREGFGLHDWNFSMSEERGWDEGKIWYLEANLSSKISPTN